MPPLAPARSTPSHTTPPPAGTSTPRTSLGGDLRIIRIMWHREMVRLVRNPLRIAMSLAVPVAFLFVLGSGISAAGPGLDGYQSFLFPGMLLTVVQGPAVAVGTAVMWDRRTGFLRQMMVAPLRRSALLAGICLGGATTGVLYGIPVLALAGPMGVPYHPRLLLVLAEVAVLAFALTAVGVTGAVCITRPETFQTLISIAMMPAILFSGAVFPVGGLPGWLGILVTLNPLSYGLDSIRSTMPGGPHTPDTAAFHSGPEWWGWAPPAALELGLVLAPALLLLLIAARRFSRIL